MLSWMLQDEEKVKVKRLKSLFLKIKKNWIICSFTFSFWHQRRIFFLNSSFQLLLFPPRSSFFCISISRKSIARKKFTRKEIFPSSAVNAWRKAMMTMTIVWVNGGWRDMSVDSFIHQNAMIRKSIIVFWQSFLRILQFFSMTSFSCVPSSSHFIVCYIEYSCGISHDLLRVV